MKFKVRYSIDVEVDAKDEDEACELAGREIESVKPHDLDAGEPRPVKQLLNKEQQIQAMVEDVDRWDKDDLIEYVQMAIGEKFKQMSETEVSEQYRLWFE